MGPIVPRSSFLVPRSSFLVPRSSFLVPRSSFLILIAFFTSCDLSEHVAQQKFPYGVVTANHPDSSVLPDNHVSMAKG